MCAFVGALVLAAIATVVTTRTLRGGGRIGFLSGGGGPSAEGFESSKRLVVVHAEWCGHCKELLKEGGVWTKVKGELPGVDVREIDEASDPDTVKSLDVTSFPDIRIIDGDKSVAKFEGERNVQSIVEFAIKHVQ